MKHLKAYNTKKSSRNHEFVLDDEMPESEYETIEDIKDICIELEDKGYEIGFGTGNGYHSVLIETGEFMFRSNHTNVFYYKDIKEVVERLKDYLGDRFFKIWTQTNDSGFVTLRKTHVSKEMYELKIGWK